MPFKPQKIIENVAPFFIIGIVIAVMFGLIILLSYVVLWGLFIGFVLWLVVWIKNYFSPSKRKLKSSKGRIIEHDDK